MRMLVAFGVALVLTAALSLYLSKHLHRPRHQGGGAGREALRLMGAEPGAHQAWAFGIATATCALAGALLIIVGPVEPNLDRLYIGRTFCVVVLAGLGSMSGTLVAGLILGIAEIDRADARWARRGRRRSRSASCWSCSACARPGCSGDDARRDGAVSRSARWWCSRWPR